MSANLIEFRPPEPSTEDHSVSDCPGQSDGVDWNIPWLCTRTAGHAGRHEAAIQIDPPLIAAAWDD